MKKLFLTILLVASISAVNAQVFNFGIKGGLNYNSNGNLKTDLTNIRVSSDQETGYHIGILTEMKLPLWLYLRPELYYTHTKSSYSKENVKADLTMDKIDAPILLGLRFLKIGRIFVGPSFHYIMNTKLKGSDIIDDLKKVSSDDFTVGAQFGLGLELGRIGVDARWESGLSDSEVKYVDKNFDLGSLNIDTSQQQFILSIYYKFN
jgi:hypothetical protein